MRIACLSGWGQPANALASLVPGALHIDYSRHSSANAALLEIAAQARGHEIIIGWSLGGQLALRAIAAGLVKARKLVLIAAPFQFVSQAQNPLGMPQDMFEKFRANYERNPEQTLHKAWELIAKDDANEETVRSHLLAQDRAAVLRQPWLYWLDALSSYSCESLYVDETPDTLIIQGARDLVVYPEQANALKGLLPAAKLHRLGGSGHAPHWHDGAMLNQLIMEFTHV